MKKMFICLMILALILTTGVAFADSPIKIFINGAEIKTDVSPFVKDGRTMVPLRFVAEALNQNVIWDNVTKQVTVASPQEKFKSYHSREDFLNDFNTAVECLNEADYNISEALQKNSQGSNSNIIRASSFIKTAQRYESYLGKYKDAAGMQEEYKQLVETRDLYSSVIAGFASIGFPRTNYNLTEFDPIERQGFIASEKLDSLKKIIGR